MILDFIGDCPAHRYLKIGVTGNNLVDVIQMIIKRNQNEVDLLYLKPYLNVKNYDNTYADRIIDLEIKQKGKDKIELTYRLTSKITNQKNVDFQIVFEDISESKTKWQSQIFNVTFDKNLNVNEIIEREYPDILEYLSNRIDGLEEKIDLCVTQYINKNYFPNIGEINRLYVDIENNEIYRYDTENNKYFLVGGDYEDIIINCNKGD